MPLNCVNLEMNNGRDRWSPRSYPAKLQLSHDNSSGVPETTLDRKRVAPTYCQPHHNTCPTRTWENWI
ncbi:hypothetical protein J6590_075684 [Homalodisca vitripennis]|nr:hypothetical protein J6590_075684 [Homalodisca vitripennis]